MASGARSPGSTIVSHAQLLQPTGLLCMASPHPLHGGGPHLDTKVSPIRVQGTQMRVSVGFLHQEPQQRSWVDTSYLSTGTVRYVTKIILKEVLGQDFAYCWSPDTSSATVHRLLTRCPSQRWPWSLFGILIAAACLILGVCGPHRGSTTRPSA